MILPTSVFVVTAWLSATPSLPTEAQLKAQTARFKPVEITADVSALPNHERAALAKILEAATLMDPLYLRQIWAGSPAVLMRLLQDTSSLGKERLRAFMLHKGPWNEQEGNAPFIPGVGEKPKSGNYYPAGATKAEVEAWLAKLSPAERAKATHFFTTIRRAPDGKFVVVPYSVEYQGELAEASRLLKEASELTTQPTLKAFLAKRAESFLSNDYYPSDVAWMELDASIEPTIGPFEVYEDGWFNYKAAFESFIALRDDVETRKLAKFSEHLQEIENNLPIDPSMRNPKLGAMAPIRVVNSIFSSGEANQGVQTAAFNLPNDERVTKEKGAKRVMLKNVQHAKFDVVLKPITKVALSKADQKQVSFDAFFTHILMHELMHGLGPHSVKVDGKETTVRQQLQDSYSSIEEAKADVSGLFALQFLMDKGVIDKSLEQSMYTTFLASSFRTLRFGAEEAHGRGMAIQLNYFLNAGAFKVAKDGTFSVDLPKMKEAVVSLTREFMTLQAKGDRAKAKEMLEKLGGVPPSVQNILDKLKNEPIDIQPQYTTARKVLEGQATAGAAASGSGK